jgi:translation initiation factor 4A
LPGEMQVGLFSATMNDNFFNITKKFMRDPVTILVKTEELTLEGIRQYYINLEQNDFKFDTLCDLYSAFSVSQSIIYCNSKKIVDILSNKLLNNNFSVSSIHGDMTQSIRDTIVKDFRDGKSRVLITTDLLSRGIDIQQISIVINYDIPKEIENYIHRIGRSGRYGRKGVAINFVTDYDKEKVQQIESYYSTEIQELPNMDVFTF